MKRVLFASFVAGCLAMPALAQDNPFAGMKGKIREGNWEYKMQMEGIPGMPAGMQMPVHTLTRCLTSKDIERGGVGSKDGVMPEGCTVSNMKMSGNTTSYTMVCTKSPKMNVDSVINFATDGFTMKQKMQIDENGKMMNMNQTMTGRYLGPCTPK